jgi:hypothetical protein
MRDSVQQRDLGSAMLVAVDAPHFYAGIVLQDGVVVEAVPILKWTVGKQRKWLSNYFQSKGWKAIVVKYG